MLLQLYNSFGLCLDPSRYESFCFTALEAILCQTSVVGFNSSGLRDIIDQKVNGCLAESYNPADFVKGIELFIYGQIQFEEGEVRSKFNLQKVSQRFLELYYKLC